MTYVVLIIVMCKIFPICLHAPNSFTYLMKVSDMNAVTLFCILSLLLLYYISFTPIYGAPSFRNLLHMISNIVLFNTAALAKKQLL